MYLFADNDSFTGQSLGTTREWLLKSSAFLNLLLKHSWNYSIDPPLCPFHQSVFRLSTDLAHVILLFSLLFIIQEFFKHMSFLYVSFRWPDPLLITLPMYIVHSQHLLEFEKLQVSRGVNWDHNIPRLFHHHVCASLCSSGSFLWLKLNKVL